MLQQASRYSTRKMVSYGTWSYSSNSHAQQSMTALTKPLKLEVFAFYCLRVWVNKNSVEFTTWEGICNEESIIVDFWLVVRFLLPVMFFECKEFHYRKPIWKIYRNNIRYLRYIKNLEDFDAIDSILLVAYNKFYVKKEKHLPETNTLFFFCTPNSF